jgi:regulatory protein
MTSGSTSSDKKSLGQKDRDVIGILTVYCAYRERSSSEVLEKLRTMGIEKSDARKLLQKLKDEGLQSDKRFAEAYVSGKLRIKRWGRVKIRYGLAAAGVDASMAEEAIAGIDEEIYCDNLGKYFDVRKKSLRKYTGIELRNRLYRSALQMGYESDLILKMLKEQND